MAERPRAATPSDQSDLPGIHEAGRVERAHEFIHLVRRRVKHSPMVEGGVAVGKHVAKRDDQRTFRHPGEEIEIHFTHLTQRKPAKLQPSHGFRRQRSRILSPFHCGKRPRNYAV
jgi:hypothetical protein